MRSLVFEGKTWEVYEQLREQDKKQHQKLCKILKEMLRNDPAQGLGKPEPLKHQLSGLWSRRLSQKDRLVYRFDDDSIFVFAIGGHYED
ncbi:Toxin YoeB [Crenothrix polyspora]|uniref:Putative mRNA interferase YoeB n=1 Tax=Crenothrix polyspora TaxID=360316 RepID=A0A1R4HHY9_9GAMM|nr:Txe/YoeB family addiction module toxin [Crenothrix polyspora]SJM95835.1 Toxin YoeB [Crenothrix polyspora]